MKTIEEVCNQISTRINNYTTEEENKVIKSLLTEILEIEKANTERIVGELEDLLWECYTDNGQGYSEYKKKLRKIVGKGDVDG